MSDQLITNGPPEKSDRGKQVFGFLMILLVLEAARLAPSACDAQPWKFIVVDDETLKQKVGEAAASFGMNKFCQLAPWCLKNRILHLQSAAC